MKAKIFIISVLILTASCQSQKKVAEQALHRPLLSTCWELNAIEKQQIEIPQSQKPYIIFDTNGRYYGNFSCNKFFGSYYFKKQKLSLKYSGSTKRLCPEMKLEINFNRSLKQSITHYKINRDTLILLDNKKEVMKFIATDSIPG